MIRRHFPLVIAVFAAGCAAAAFLSIFTGAAMLSPSAILDAAFNGGNTPEWRIFFYVRLPRTFACLAAGAGLAVSGAVIQSVLANKLASPGIIGVNAGAGLGVTVCCAVSAVSGWYTAAAAFIGALAAVIMTVALTAGKTGASRSTVILGGVAVNSFLTAVSEGITTLVPDIASMTADFKTGGFAGVTPSRVYPASIIILITLVIVFSLSNELDLLSMGEETAQGLGLHVKSFRTVFLALAALLAGSAVSFAGLLGFVGLIVPNMVRKITGGESKKLIPVCAMGGALFVTLCDCAARVVFPPYEIPTGIVMSALGAPFFIFLLIKNKGGHSNG